MTRADKKEFAVLDEALRMAVDAPLPVGDGTAQIATRPPLLYRKFEEQILLLSIERREAALLRRLG